MSGFFQDLLQDAAGTFFGSDYLRDYTHAAKTFRTNAYQYAPKFKFLFHVYFDINPQVYNIGLANGANYGLAVKTIKLPSFNLEVQTLNQYNRKRLNQTKIKYDPIDVTFHDDNGNIVRNMWKAYYNYYYADGLKAKVDFTGTRTASTNPVLNYLGGGTLGAQNPSYNERTQYTKSITGDDNWGYIGETSQANGKKLPFFKNITVFGMNQHNYAAYTLINPIITKWSHDTYSYAEGGGTMENQMGIDYETVVYNEGAIDGRTPGNIITGFATDENYDRTLSPISKPGSNGTILGQGGLIDGAGGVINGINDAIEGKPLGILGAIQAAGTTYNTFKNVNIAQIAKQEVVNGLQNAVLQTPNRNLGVSTPIFGASPQTQGVAGAPTSGTTAAPSPVGVNQYAGTANK
jgi:hypothetical protein